MWVVRYSVDDFSKCISFSYFRIALRCFLSLRATYPCACVSLGYETKIK